MILRAIIIIIGVITLAHLNIFKCISCHPSVLFDSWQMVYLMTHWNSMCCFYSLCASTLQNWAEPSLWIKDRVGLLLPCWHSWCSCVLGVLQQLWQDKSCWKVMSHVTLCLWLPIGSQSSVFHLLLWAHHPSHLFYPKVRVGGLV